MQRTHFAGRARVRWLLLRCDELKANIGTGGRNASMYQPKQSNPTMKRRMPKPNMLQLSAMSPTADSAEESERAQVVQAVSFRRTRLMPKDRHLHLMTVGAILLFGMGTEAFTSPLTRYSSHNSICSDFFPRNTVVVFVIGAIRRVDVQEELRREPRFRKGGRS